MEPHWYSTLPRQKQNKKTTTTKNNNTFVPSLTRVSYRIFLLEGGKLLLFEMH